MPATSPGQAQVTIGVAVAVPEPWASQVQEYRLSLGDDQASVIPTHITLIPPTAIAHEVLGDIERHLEAVAAQQGPFRVRLGGTGTFRPVSAVVFAAVAEGDIGSCERLADAVRRGPLDVDLAFPYHPHVTLAHDLPEEALDRALAELADFECEFAVEKFHLYMHREAEGWSPIRSFALDAHAVARGGH